VFINIIHVNCVEKLDNEAKFDIRLALNLSGS
jgi:hypothetical protein